MRAMFPDRFLVLVLAGLSADSASAGQTEPAFLSRAPQALALAFGSSDGTFHRLRQDCTTLAGSAANAVYYDTVVLGNPNNVELVLDVRTQPPGGDGSASCDVNRDTVMMAYADSFDPNAPSQNCIAYNDDAPSPNLDRCSRISGLAVPANGRVVVVVAAFSNGENYPYDLRFDGTALRTDVVFADGFGDAVLPATPATAYAAHVLSGQVVVDGVMAPIPQDSWVDGVLGAQGQFAGFAQIAPMTLSGMTDFGLLTTRLQWIDAGGGFGLAPVSGAASLSFAGMQLRLQSISLNGAPINIGGECRFSPVSWGMSGNSGATTIDVSDPQFSIPTTSDACGGFQAQLNSLFSGTLNSVDWRLDR